MSSRLSMVLLAILAGMCACDGAGKRYATLADAQASGIIARGWLPDVLPSSAHNIRVSTDLDLNTSAGEFSFAPAEFDALLPRLQPYVKAKHPFTAGFDVKIAGHMAAGYPALQYKEEDSIWVFLCRPKSGHCDYTMWLER